MSRPESSDPLKVALLSYRGNPNSGGQGVYVRHLSRALVRGGHWVEVFSGPPYPRLDPDVPLTRLESLDLYRSPDPFRWPRRSEFRDGIDVLEYALMCTAGFPEPLTFSLRARRELRGRGPGAFDVVHDNQCLGYGLWGLAPRSVPVVATIHHPIKIDRRLDLAHASGWRKVSLRRWYGFVRMQERVARRLPQVITVSHAAREEIVREMGLSPDRVAVVHNGVDTELFRPLPHIARKPGRIVTTASADTPLKGVVPLLEAVAKLRVERDVELVVVGRPKEKGVVRAAVHRLGMADCVTFVHDIDDDHLVELYATAAVAVVPSLYEGFSFPAAEAMACQVPLVATNAGALPEVVGDDGEAALLVPPADPEAMVAAVGHLLDHAELRARMGLAARRRVGRLFSWERTAEATVDQYRAAIARC